MRSPRRGRVLAVLTCSLLAVVPATASAAVSQESMMQDDVSLIFNTPSGTAKALDTMARLGVDRVRVSLFWATVAPQPRSQTRPKNFNAANPAAYSPGAWDRYDQVVRLAHARGIAVNFNITSPAPLWATGDDAPRKDLLDTWKPDPSEFEQFVRAVGLRYGGNYGAAGGSFPQATPSGFCKLANNCPPPEPQPPVLKDGPVPRVDYWSIWNEPNQPGWLTPQWEPRPDGQPGTVEASPRIYRSLADAALRGLRATGHYDDTILIGETAPKGTKRTATSAMSAMRFMRNLYCLDDSSHPYRDAEAAARDCPQDDAGTAAWADQHPVLFTATGYAHHPYELTAPPNRRPADPDYVTTANLPTLTLGLRRAFAAYGRPNGLPLYLTEFGYNTRPPNPLGVTAAQQAAYLNQAQYIASNNPSVRVMTQFLLVDSKTKAPGPGYAATFQTGLEYFGGGRKPSFNAYQLVLHLPTAKIKRNGLLLVWGLVRPASQLGRQLASIELRRPNGTWQTLKRTVTQYGRGVVNTRVRIARSGSLRLAWRDPRTKQVVHSRIIPVVAK